MAINSRQKGARGERLFRDELREEGFTARRGQQFSGGAESPDVICEELGHLHFEIKCVEALNIHKAIAQSVKDAGAHKIPIVAHKRNRGEWLITMRADDWFPMLREALPVKAPSETVQIWGRANRVLPDSPFKGWQDYMAERKATTEALKALASQPRLQSDGWRFLNQDEIVQSGDQYEAATAEDGNSREWEDADCLAGETVTFGFTESFRRRVEPAVKPTYDLGNK